MQAQGNILKKINDMKFWGRYAMGEWCRSKKVDMITIQYIHVWNSQKINENILKEN